MNNDFSKDYIKKNVITQMGVKFETLPDEVKNLLN